MYAHHCITSISYSNWLHVGSITTVDRSWIWLQGMQYWYSVLYQVWRCAAGFRLKACCCCVVQVELVVRKGAEYLLVVEGFSSTDKGNYELTIEQAGRNVDHSFLYLCTFPESGCLYCCLSKIILRLLVHRVNVQSSLFGLFDHAYL